MSSNREQLMPKAVGLALPAESVIDGIRTSFSRWVRVREPGPFVFNFLDYLKLALPLPCEITISTPEGGQLVATSPDMPAATVLPDQATLQLTEERLLLGFQSSMPGIVDTVESILCRLDARARRHVARVIRLGLNRIRPCTSSTTDYTSCSLQPQRNGIRTRSILDDIVTRTGFHLARAIARGDEAYEFAVRPLACEESLTLLGYRSVDNGIEMAGRRDAPKAWDKEVQLAFKTGFVRLKAVELGKLLLCIPCHFGGVAWLVLCCEVNNDALGRWQAYSIYRDVIPRLTDALRERALESFAREMLRLFRVANSDVKRDAETAIREVNEVWKHLTCVYPLPRVSLREVPTGLDRGLSDRLVLPLRNGLAEVCFEPDMNPCVSTATRLKSRGGEPWGAGRLDKLRRDFLQPILIAFQEERSREAFQLAEARKMALGHLGHTLKHRLDTVKAYLDKQGQRALSRHMLMLEDLTVILQLNTVDDRNELLTLEKRNRFLDYADAESAGPLDLRELILHDWSDQVAREQSYSEEGRRFNAWCRLDIHSRIDKAQVVYTLTDRDGRRCRATSTVYRELLFELLLNARRYGYVRPCPGERHDDLPVVSVRCDLGMAEVEGRRLLTLVNQTDPDKELPGHLQSAEWRPWPAARKYDGPGMALELFRRLELGDLFYRSRSLVTGQVFFAVGLDLIGLEIT